MVVPSMWKFWGSFEGKTGTRSRGKCCTSDMLNRHEALRTGKGQCSTLTGLDSNECRPSSGWLTHCTCSPHIPMTPQGVLRLAVLIGTPSLPHAARSFSALLHIGSPPLKTQSNVRHRRTCYALAAPHSPEMVYYVLLLRLLQAMRSFSSKQHPPWDPRIQQDLHEVRA